MQKLNRGSSRSVKAKKNICWMLLIKGGNVLIGILLIPMTLGYVNSDTYGLWIALSSMIAWISFFDIGINNGLKNNLAKALAIGDHDKAKTYISTTYGILTLIFIPLMFMLLCAIPYVDWYSLLNISHADRLSASICVIVAYFCINFILSTIDIVLIADQRPADASFRGLIQQIVSLVIIFILTRTTQGSLLNLCLALCIPPVVIIALFSFTLFKGRYKQMAPSLKSIDFRQAPVLMKLGIQFFIIQIAGIIQYQMINFLIMRYYGAENVVSYNISYKYFNVLAMLWGIIIAPAWVAVTDAITKGEYGWVARMKHKYLQLFCVFACLGILMLLLSDVAYNLWIGDKVTVGIEISVVVLLYILVAMFGGIFVSIINGSGQLRLQMYASIVSPFVFISAFYLFSHIWQLGLISVILAAIISNFNGFVIAPLQCRQILKSYGI